MKRMISAILSVLLILSTIGVLFTMTSCKSVGTTYYVSSSQGNDSNSGTSEGSAWKSFANVNCRVLQPGDKVLLKRGDEWNERLEIYGLGTEKDNIVVSCYGDKNADRPLIKLNNDIMDICLLLTDVYASEIKYPEDANKKVGEFGNILVEELDLRQAYLGICIRSVLHDDSQNIIIRNCDISEIYNDEIESKCSSKAGATVENYHQLSETPRGNLPDVNRNNMKITQGAGGSGEWLYGTAIKFIGYFSTVFKNAEIYNVVMENCSSGIEAYRVSDFKVHDVVNTGSWAGVARFSESSNISIDRARLMSGSYKYTFFGGTCGGFFGQAKNAYIANSEFAYEKNLGENDGCGFDFEYQCHDSTIKNSVFHHNDSGSLLFMGLMPGGLHERVAIDGILGYSNMRNAVKVGYNYDLLIYNEQGDENNIVVKNSDFYCPAKAPSGYDVRAWGNFHYNAKAFTTPIIDCTENPLTGYRTRFSFNKDNFAEGITANKGTLSVGGGKATLTANGNMGAIQFNETLNGFCYNTLALKVTNNAKGTLYVQYKTDGEVRTSKNIKINGEGVYTLSLSDEAITSPMKDIVLIFKPSQSGGEIVFDNLQFITDINISVKKVSDKVYDVIFGGKCFPMIDNAITKDDISIGGVTVTKLEKRHYNVARVTLSDNISGDVTVAVTGHAFIEYFADLVNGLDNDRTAAQDAELLGCTPENYAFYNGTVSQTVKVK